MPALIFQGRPLLSLMRAKGHIGIYPYSSVVVAAVLETLPAVDGLSAAKGTVRLPLGAEIPEIVIRQLVLARSEEIRQALAKKPTARPRVAKHADLTVRDHRFGASDVAMCAYGTTHCALRVRTPHPARPGS